MFAKFTVLLGSVLIIYCKTIPQNNTAIISTYAKVAHWGAARSTTSQPKLEARSHNGQTLWTQRSDVNIVKGQNLKKPSVVYQYPVHKNEEKFETYPAVGEVQERFNPRPYFDYAPAPQKPKRSDQKTKSAPAPSPTFDSFPIFNQPLDSPPSPDLYASGYSSYNPPNAGPVGPPIDAPGIAYPPNIGPASDNSNNNSPPEGYSYNPPQKLESAVAYPSLGPPLAPASNNIKMPHNDNNDESSLFYPPSNEKDTETILDHPPPGWKESEPSSSNMMNDQHNHHDNMLDHPPTASWNAQKNPLREPSHGHQETILDYPPPGWKDPNTQMGGDDMKSLGHDMAEHDLAPPPPAPSQNFENQFPSYVYNGGHDQGHDFGSYDFDHHHIYKEVTTTTEAPEDERVNKGHYSYYYLGRKLWYIPLYFSVYFIIYVTVLILKSIARHKVQLKHEHFGREKDKGRSLDLNDVYQNVTEGIEKSRRKFTYVAM